MRTGVIRRWCRPQWTGPRPARIIDPMATEASTDIPREWLEEFEAAAKRPLSQRWKYAFIKTYKPVLDDATYRSFDTTAEYRRWCAEHLPSWLGYGRV
jgi:hypothetical protein